jgi:hypothetical protein
MASKAQSVILYVSLVIAVAAVAISIYLLIGDTKRRSEVPPGTGPTGAPGPPGQRGITGPTGPAGIPGNLERPVQLIAMSHLVEIPQNPTGTLTEHDTSGAARYFEVMTDGTLNCVANGNFEITAFARCTAGNQSPTYFALMTDSSSPWDKFFSAEDLPQELLLQEISHQLQPASYSFTSQLQVNLNQILQGNVVRVRYRIQQNGAFNFNWIFVITPA